MLWRFFGVANSCGESRFYSNLLFLFFITLPVESTDVPFCSKSKFYCNFVTILRLSKDSTTKYTTVTYVLLLIPLVGATQRSGSRNVCISDIQGEYGVHLCLTVCHFHRQTNNTISEKPTNTRYPSRDELRRTVRRPDIRTTRKDAKKPDPHNGRNHHIDFYHRTLPSDRCSA